MIHFWWSPRTNPSFSGQTAVPGGSWTLVEVFILRAQNVSVILGERIGANRTDTNRNWGGRIPLPSGKQSHNYGKIQNFQWVNPLFLWDIHHFQWVLRYPQPLSKWNLAGDWGSPTTGSWGQRRGLGGDCMVQPHGTCPGGGSHHKMPIFHGEIKIFYGNIGIIWDDCVPWISMISWIRINNRLSWNILTTATANDL